MPRKRKRPSVESKTDVQATLSTLLPDVQYRPIRPRPLPFDEQLRVWSLDDPEFQEFNPQLATWVKERIALAHALQDKQVQSRSRANTSDLGSKEETIQIPGFQRLTDVPKVSDTELACTQAPLEERAYIRHIEKTQEELDDQVEYDLDSDDEHWLDNRHKKGLLDLDAVLLETLIDRFERAQHAELERQQILWERNAPSRTGVPPEDRDPSVLYPASKAIKDFGHEHNSLSLRAAHNYWAQKAGKSKTPLLQRFWYDKRWARQNALMTRREEHGDSDDSHGVPFQGKETPRKAARGRTLAVDDVRSRLLAARTDLEAVRTLADQVKRREKVRRRYLQAWQHELRVSAAIAKKKQAKPRQPAKVDSAMGKKATKAAGKQENKAVPIRTAPKATAAKATEQKPKGQKKVSFKSTADAVLPKSEPKAAPRTGIVSAVVERLRRLSSWGIAQPRNDAKSSPNPDSDLPEPGAEKADLLSEPKQAGQGPRKRQRAVEVPVQKGVSSHASLDPDLLKGSEQIPPGFARRPATSGGANYWQAICKAGTFDLKSCLDIQRFLQQHGRARPAWKALQQQADESGTAHRHRLRLLFPFSEAQDSTALDSPRAQSKAPHRDSANLEARNSTRGAASKSAANSTTRWPASKKSKTVRRKPADDVTVSVEDTYIAEPAQSSRTRSGARFGSHQPDTWQSLQTIEDIEEDLLDYTPEADTSDDVSSGSETYMLAEEDSSDVDLDAPESYLKRSRRSPHIPHRSGLRSNTSEPFSSKDSDDDNVSDMSAFTDESDTPSPALPPQTRAQQQLSRRPLQHHVRQAKPKVNRGIVAAARRQIQRRQA